MDTFYISFDPQPKITIFGNTSTDYLIEMYEYRNNIKEHIHDIHLSTNNWGTSFREWYTDIQFDIFTWDEKNGLIKILEHRYNDTNKNVLINLDTDHLHEALVWYNCAKEYQKIHNCKLFIKSNFNDVLKNEKSDDVNFVTDIEQAEPYAIYNVGKYDTEYEWNKKVTGTVYSWVFNKNRDFCSYRNPRDWHYISLTDVANDILGINKNL